MTKTEAIEFRFSDDDIANLALQRSGQFLALGGGNALNAWFQTGDTQPIKRLLSQPDAKRRFLEETLHDIAQELDLLERHFDFSKVNLLTSIGPGLCVFELLLSLRHPCNMYLIDIENSIEHAHGYKPTGSGYSNNAAARSFLVANGVSPDCVRFCNPRTQAIDHSKVDLIMSNLSMGFHYPVDEYASYIRAALDVGGTLIFDQRKGAQDPAWQALSEDFPQSKAIDFGKYRKLICERRGRH